MNSKYHAKKVKTADGTFDSKKEYKRWIELNLLQQAGIIDMLDKQVKYELIPKQKDPKGKAVRAVTYTADFVYLENGEFIVEDTKGYKTEVYKLKKKLMYQKYGIWIKET